MCELGNSATGEPHPLLEKLPGILRFVHQDRRFPMFDISPQVILHNLLSHLSVVPCKFKLERAQRDFPLCGEAGIVVGHLDGCVKSEPFPLRS